MLALLIAMTIPPVFWTASTVWVEPEDDLASADRPVAACLAKQLPTQLPMTLAASKEDADVVYRVRGNLPSATTRVMVGVLGGSPSANLTVLDKSGKQLWSDGAKLRRAMMGRDAAGGRLESSDGDMTVYCGLATELLDTLREAMKKARGSK